MAPPPSAVVATAGQPAIGQVWPVGHLVDFTIRQGSTLDVVSTGLVFEDDARMWFSTFFEGCDRFVPVFDTPTDNYDSVRNRSSTLFDIILIFGARAAHGVMSRPYQKLYGLLRQHTSDLVLRLSGSAGPSISIEDIQGLLVIASYSDSGAILCDVALRASMEAGLSRRLDDLFAIMASHSPRTVCPDQASFACTRVWYYLYVLDMILSVDGGKPPSISLRSESRRVRVLLNHQQRTPLDIRLFAQVELNALRANAHASIAAAADNSSLEISADSTVRCAILDLDLWLSEWQGFMLGDASLSSEHNVMSLNLQIQHAWAILTLHLRALMASGVDNIALMTEDQCNIALAAKAAAERHLQLLLTDTASSAAFDGASVHEPQRPYVANLEYAMEFVWAKNAFCILIVLRLGILLGDSPSYLLARLAEAKEFLHELDKVGMGTNVSYARMLFKIVEKCEKAVNSSLQSGSERNSAEPGDGDFQSFIPKEFMFQWDFPGLHLCYIPMDRQDLFLDFIATA